jgi:Arc/MetJ family transcription regulator
MIASGGTHPEEGVMRTNIDIDDKLLAEAAKVFGTTTKKATVEAALERAVRRRRQRRILELEGKVEWVGDLDEMRSGREFPL